MEKLLDITAFDYDLPAELIAHEPAIERDTARLFMYDTASDYISFDTFQHIDQYLPQHSALILNDTKVVPARLEAKKETGGRVELLLLLNEWRPGERIVKSLADRKVTIEQRLFVTPDLFFTVRGQHENIFLLEPNVPADELPALLEMYGQMPVPPYLKPTTLREEDVRERYQSVFAKHPASVAAPTASLHFTPRVFENLKKKDIPLGYVTLHVGLGTFAPVSEHHLRSKKLHQEFTDITEDEARRMNEWRQEGKALMAVGTTAARVLESHAADGRIHSGSLLTDIFITPGYSFQAVDGLLTNFHLPQSSLMMLVEALLIHKKAKKNIKELYEVATREKFRFYSFGDAMLIL